MSALRCQMRLGWREVFATVVALGVVVVLPAQAQAAIVTWDGGGADNNWNTVANWVGDVAPGTLDVATFDATSVKNATVNANISVAGINIVSTYTGTITQAAGRPLEMGGRPLTQVGGFLALPEGDDA